MIAHKKKKKKRVLSPGELSIDVSSSEMGLKSLCSNSAFDPDYIKELVNDIRKFSHMLLYLKEAILSDCFKEVIYIRLDELLRVLKFTMNKHDNLNSVDLQNAAETLTAKVKAVNFTDVNEENKNDLFREVFSSIETLAFTFGHVLTNFLMGDLGNDSVFRLSVSQENKSFENVSVESVDSSIEKGNFSPIELDSMLLKNTDSVELALSYVKTWSKYTKNIVSWVEKKLTLELESSRNIVKLAEATRTNFGQQEFMPLQSVFTSALTNDIESSHLLQQTIAALQANKFVQPLLGRKNEMEKQRKEIKELWKQEQNKVLETETALKKAKLLCTQRQDEYEKAKSSMFRAEEEHQCSSGGLVKNVNKQLEKKRRLEEEALQKVEEANEVYKACVINVEERRNDLEIIKREILTQLQKLIFQCDRTLKAVTVNLFQMQQEQAASLANNLQSFCDRAKLYDLGQEYSKFVKATDSTEEEKVDGSVTKPSMDSSHTSEYGPADSLEDVVRRPHSSSKVEEDRCSTSADVTGGCSVRPWTFGMFSDSESTGGSSESRSLDSESISPGDFHRKLPRTPSSGTMSSADDLEEREPPSPSEGGPNSVGSYKKTLMSKAALTHKFRKWRSPTKCRDCEGYVVFQGVECEECLLVCHRKCLENLVIICGHQKLPGKTHLFGAEFTQIAKKEPDGVPFALKMCVSEIESRALCLQGIYRVSGNKIKTEKLCQALENGMNLVDISEFSSHDICDVLKFYLRQLPEPFISFRLYKEFIDLAKEIQQVNEEAEARKDGLEDQKWPSTCIEINRILLKSKDLLRQLPASNFNSLHYLIMHLKRVVDHSEENKMTSKNLGVIFGPSLIRPRPTTVPITIGCLAEYSNQARLVEFLITYSRKIFDGSLQPKDVAMCSTGSVAPQTDQGCHLKPLLSPEEREPQHLMKSLVSPSKKDIHTPDRENKSLEPVASLEELERKQNVSEKCDACLIDNKVRLLADQGLETASQKMEDVSKTCEPFALKPDRETNSAMERCTPRTKSRPVTVNLFQMQQEQAASLANNLQSFCDRAKLYDLGQEYSKFVKATDSTEEEKVDGSVTKPSMDSSHTSEYRPADSLEDVVRRPHSSSKVEEDRCFTSADVTGGCSVRPWTFGMFSDSESTGGSSESRSLDSESISPGDFHRKLPRTPSSGTMSSADDLEEREPPSPSEGPISVGRYKKTLMSKAALTHKFRKWRSPTKCRDCGGNVGFHGVKCEKCLLVCHQKCMKNLIIICGHQKLLGKTHLFGAELTEVAKTEPDGIPFVLKMCVSEMESRTLCLEDIYRMCGNRIKTKKLCQALENGMNLVDISEFSSHDICDVLKFYLRQLPKPLISFRLYNEFRDLATEFQQVNEETNENEDGFEDQKWPSACREINQILLKSKDLLRQLPASNFNCLHYFIMHLKRVVDHSEENKMTSRKLAVIFAPCVIRPRPRTVRITNTCVDKYKNMRLVDYHQVWLVEFLITYSQKIFDGSLQPQDVAMCSTASVAPQTDQGCNLKPLLSPEEREPQHLMKSLISPSKKDIHTPDRENKSLERVASLEELEQKQNVSEKCDACLIDNKVRLLADQGLETASQKMEDVSKTCEPFALKPDRETNSAMERCTPRTKSRPVTVNLFQMQQEQAASLANNLQSFCDRAKLYDLGQEYSKFVKATDSTEEEKVDGTVTKSSTHSSHTYGYGPADSLEDVARLPHSSRKVEEDRCSTSADVTGPISVGRYKKTLMSKAALTHKFRKWRSPTKCRDCGGNVGFHGVKCEKCLLVCHQKCMKNLIIICGHQKLLGKTRLFGAELTEVAKTEPDGIPFVLKMCVSEMESRTLCLEDIYRMCGNRIKTKKLCQALENGMNLVDISEFSSHDICDVLKFYLRQLPKPLISFRLYNEFRDLATEFQQVNEETNENEDGFEDQKWPSACREINQILLKSKDLLRQLPASNFNCLHYFIMHLKRVVDHSEENKMTSRKLAVIFAPCVIRPRPRTVRITNTCVDKYKNMRLVDYHQVWLVEFLITYSQKIFDGSLQPQDVAMCSTASVAPQTDQGCNLKPLLSPEEREPQHLMKSLISPSKKDIHTPDRENKSLERVASLEELEQKQNVSEKCDACLIDNKVRLLADQGLETASQKMEDVSKTCEPFALKPDRETNSAMERCTPRTKSRPVTVNLFQMQQEQAASLANNLQSFCDRAKLYDLGQEYSKFVKATDSTEEEKVDGSVTKPSMDSSHTSEYRPADSLEDVVRRPHSSSKVEEDRCSTSADVTGPISVGRYKKTLMSKAALTHKFRKWRSPTKCRDCGGNVGFHGVKCEKCLLVCHQKCMKNLIIICGHQKLLGKTRLFGAELTEVAKTEPDGIPFVLKMCVSEMESRTLCLEDIYRMCGNRIKTKKLCQALENGMNLVDISEFSSHDICDVLKFYLRQLPKPLISFRLYNEFRDLATEFQQVNEETNENEDGFEDQKWPSACREINHILLKSKDLLRQLPASNFNCLHYFIMHLKRVVDHSEENKMTSRKLAVIFAPCVIRPRPRTVRITNTCVDKYKNMRLVDYHQVWLVEFLITYSQKIFDGSLQPQDVAMCSTASVAPQTDQGCNLKPLLSPEEREPQHLMKSLISPSKKDIHTPDRENKSLERVASLEELEQKQNVSEKCDACLIDNKVRLLADQGLETASQKMEDVSKTCEPFALKPDRETNSAMERCTPRTKSRPVSLPVDRLLLLANPPHERNGRNMGNVNSDTLCKYPTFEGVNTPTICCKFDGFDQQSLQNTGEKQYEQSGLNGKTALIVPNTLQEGGVTTSMSIGGDHLVSTTQPSKPCPEPGRSARQVSEGRSSDSCPAAPIRAPRTLQPQHWTTFYKPRAPPGSVSGTEAKPVASSPTVPPGTAHAAQEHVLKSVSDSENAPAACPLQPTSKPKENCEERDLPDVHLTCQRPRLKQCNTLKTWRMKPHSLCRVVIIQLHFFSCLVLGYCVSFVKEF